MTKMIRWQGVVAFVVVSAVLVGVPFLFLDSWIKSAVETYGGKSLGAEVNVASVSHRWSPFGVTLNGVQITDAEKNTHNRVAFDRLSADVALLPLFERKIIVDELQLTGVKFDTERSSPGKVFTETAADEDASKSAKVEETSVADIDIAGLVKRTPLKTTDAATKVGDYGNTAKQKLTEQFNALPDEKVLKSYETRIQAILDREIDNAADLAEAKKALDALKKELKAEKQKLENFAGQVANSSSGLQQSLSELAAAQKQDYDLLKGLVAGDAASIDNLTEAIFGLKLKSWSDNLFAAYRLVAPLLQSNTEEESERQRLAGRWISFAEQEPLPDVLVRKAEISLLYKESEFSSLWENITNDHEILGAATTYMIDSQRTAQWQALKIDGNFQFLKNGLTALQTWDLKGISVAGVELAQTESLQSSLQQAVLNSVGRLHVTDNKLEGKSSIQLAEMLLQATGSGKTSTLIAEFLGDLKVLDIDTTIAGFLKDPQFGFSSDLDSQLAKQLSKSVGAAAQKKLTRLQNEIAQQASPSQQAAAAQLADWDNLKDVANGKTDVVEEMLQAQLDSVVDKEADKLKNQLQKKLFGG